MNPQQSASSAAATSGAAAVRGTPGTPVSSLHLRINITEIVKNDICSLRGQTPGGNMAPSLRRLYAEQEIQRKIMTEYQVTKNSKAKSQHIFWLALRDLGNLIQKKISRKTLTIELCDMDEINIAVRKAEEALIELDKVTAETGDQLRENISRLKEMEENLKICEDIMRKDESEVKSLEKMVENLEKKGDEKRRVHGLIDQTTRPCETEYHEAKNKLYVAKIIAEKSKEKFLKTESDYKIADMSHVEHQVSIHDDDLMGPDGI